MSENTNTQVTFPNGGQVITDRLNFPGTRVYSWVALTHPQGVFVASGCCGTRAEAHAEAVASLSVVRAIKTVSAETAPYDHGHDDARACCCTQSDPSSVVGCPVHGSDGTFTQDDQGNWYQVGGA